MLLSFRDLKVWQSSMDLAEEVYRATARMPREELFGLTSQIRRAAASIPANIAEGRSRCQLKVYLNHLGIAKGSLAELETHLLLVQRLGLLRSDAVASLLERAGNVGRMLNGLIRRLREAGRGAQVAPVRTGPTGQSSRNLNPET